MKSVIETVIETIESKQHLAMDEYQMLNHYLPREQRAGQ